jgi:hypothetical protein
MAQVWQLAWTTHEKETGRSIDPHPLKKIQSRQRKKRFVIKRVMDSEKQQLIIELPGLFCQAGSQTSLSCGNKAHR